MGLIPWQFFLIGDTAESPLHARTLTCTHTDMHGHQQVRGVPVGRWPPGQLKVNPANIGQSWTQKGLQREFGLPQTMPVLVARPHSTQR